MKLVILGKVPAKKNSRQLFVRNGRIVNIPNKTYQQWEHYALVQLARAQPVEHYPTGINIVIYSDTKRRFDLDNTVASCMDMLVKAGVLEDDSVDYVDSIGVTYGGLDKTNPRAEIILDD